jgi:hypothetical protein
MGLSGHFDRCGIDIPRQQVFDPVDGMVGDASHHFPQIGFGIQTVQSVRSSVKRQPTPGIYIPPNEQHPAVALPIFRKSNQGVYISVGTERAFIGSALREQQPCL